MNACVYQFPSGAIRVYEYLQHPYVLNASLIVELGTGRVIKRSDGIVDRYFGSTTYEGITKLMRAEQQQRGTVEGKISDAELIALVAENMWVVTVRYSKPKHGYILKTISGKTVHAEVCSQCYVLRAIEKEHNELLKVIAKHIQNPPYLVQVEKAPDQQQLESLIDELSAKLAQALDHAADRRLDTPPIRQWLREFADAVRGIEEDLRKRYHLDSGFHQFVDQMVVHEMLAAEGSACLSENVREYLDRMEKVGLRVDEGALRQLNDELVVAVGRQQKALEEIEGMGFATPNEMAYKMVAIARRGLGKLTRIPVISEEIEARISAFSQGCKFTPEQILWLRELLIFGAQQLPPAFLIEADETGIRNITHVDRLVKAFNFLRDSGAFFERNQTGQWQVLDRAGKVLGTNDSSIAAVEEAMASK